MSVSVYVSAIRGSLSGMTLLVVALAWVALSVVAGLFAGRMLRTVQAARVIAVSDSAGVSRYDRGMPVRGRG
jgi:hypothetical protein